MAVPLQFLDEGYKLAEAGVAGLDHEHGAQLSTGWRLSLRYPATVLVHLPCPSPAVREAGLVPHPYYVLVFVLMLRTPGAPGATTATGTGRVGTTSWTGWAVGSNEAQIVQLQKRVDQLHTQMTTVQAQLMNDRQEWERRHQELELALQSETAKLHDLHHKGKSQTDELDAAGLPLIAFGILLSGIPDWIARIPLELGWVFPSTALVVAAVTIWPGRRAEERAAALGGPSCGV